MTTATYYIDAHVSETNNGWVNRANAWDGSTSTYAEALTELAVEVMTGVGTTAPSTHQGVIARVEGRFYGRSITGNCQASFSHGNLTNLKISEDLIAPSTAGWTGWVDLQPSVTSGNADQGWTWANLRNLAVTISAISGSTGEAYRAEIRVTYFATSAGLPDIKGWDARSSDGSTVTSLTVYPPEGTESGDLLVLWGASDADNPSGTQLSINSGTYPGWTKIAEVGDGTSDCSLAAWWRAAGASEGSVVIDSSASDEMTALIMRISGADTTAPINDHNGRAYTATNHGSPYIHDQNVVSGGAPVTTTSDDCLIISSTSHDGSDVLANATFNQTTFTLIHALIPESSGNDVGQTLFYYELPTAGNVTTDQFSTSTNDGYNHYTLAIEPGATGGNTLSAEAGSYAVTGSAADFEVGMEADAGSYSVTGSAANFTLGKTLGVESGSYALTGEDVTFLNAEVLSAESGSYAITGEDADFLNGEVLSAESGSYSYTGAEATLTQSIAATLNAESGSYTVTGSDADLLGAFVLETQVTGTEIAYCTEYTEGSTKAWTNEFNAVNGSTANYAYTNSEGWVNTDAERINPAGAGHYYAGEISLYAAFPAANAQADTISKVRYRVYTQATGTGTPQLEVTVRDESASERGAWSLLWLQQDRFTKTTAGWTDWTDISPPAGGWSTYDPTTWPDTTNGLVAFYVVGKDDTGDLTELRIYKLEVEYTYTDAVYTTALGAVDLQGDLDHQVDAGSYTYAGSDANFTLSNALSAEAGAYSVTGSDADLEYAVVMPVESGSYSLTGSEVTFQTSGAFAVPAGSYTVTGEDVTFEYEGRLLAESGSYALTGESADLKRGYGLDAEDSLYNIGFFPQNAMYRGLVLPAESGSYAVTGADATLAYQFDGALAAVPGAYAYTGADANLLYQRVVNVDAGSYSYTGDDVDYSLTYSLLAGAGSYACSGADATLRYSGVAGRRVIMIG